MTDEHDTPRVKVDVGVDGVAQVRMARPEKMNALDPAMFEALVEAGESLKSEPSVRAVVLSGEGRAFCAGLDFSGFQALAGGDKPQARRSSLFDTDGRITHLGQQAAWVWAELPVPVIAAVHGHALGGGCQIALAADIRIVAPDAQLSVLEIRWGLTPDMTATVSLARLVGIDVAKELTWTGRMVAGAEAVAMGLATRVSDDPLADATELAGRIAAQNPHAIRGAKRLLDEVGGIDLAGAFARERAVIGSLIGSPNQREAVTAFFEKRPPAFADPD